MKTDQNGPKRITLADVAREANVSVQTASHVMAENLTVRLPEATRERVKAAATRVGYRPNRIAQAMKRGRSNVIAVWMTLDRPSILTVRMLSGINGCARAANFDLMIIGLDNSMAYSAEGRTPNLWPVDGVIAIDAGKAIRKFREDPNNDGTPVCVLGYEEYDNGDAVAWNVRDSVYMAIGKMINAGKRNIVHVSPDWVLENYPREQRRRGYSEAMEVAGLAPKLIPAAGETSDAAEAAMTAYLLEHPLPQAVFGFTDQMAIGAARAALATGAEIPKDCWILGFGDAPEAADFRIPLTSLRTPIEPLVEQSWSWLMERIGNSTLAPRTAVFPMELIERESTGPMG